MMELEALCATIVIGAGDCLALFAVNERDCNFLANKLSHAIVENGTGKFMCGGMKQQCEEAAICDLHILRRRGNAEFDPELSIPIANESIWAPTKFV
jgi:hypothetical protein